MKFNDQSMGMKISFFVFLQLIFFLANGNPATNNPILNSSDTERYFTVETARGYIVINREYEYAYI
jgi:hypothetical protein